MAPANSEIVVQTNGLREFIYILVLYVGAENFSIEIYMMLKIYLGDFRYMYFCVLKLKHIINIFMSGLNKRVTTQSKDKRKGDKNDK